MSGDQKPEPCRCGGEATVDLHPCPYDEDVERDPEPKCRCCKECEDKCADDI